MLPTNPQSMSTADKSILENLREQGAQIDRQARVMEKLVDRIARMMTAEERVEKKTKKKDNKIEGDTKIKDVPGLLIDKLADKLDDSITKQFLKIKDSFKKEKQEPIDRSQEPASTEKEKEKKPKDETDTLRSILNSMIGNSKYQEQMTENSKALQSIADKTLTNVDNLNDNLKNIEQPEANNTEKENKTEEKNNKKEGKLNNNQKLAIDIGVSIAAALKPQFDTLGKTLKEALEKGFAELTTALDNMSGNAGGFGVGVPSGGPGGDGKDGKGGKGGKGGSIFKDAAKKIMENGKGVVGGASKLALPAYLAYEALSPPSDEEMQILKEAREKKEAEAEAERLANLKKRSATGKLIKKDPVQVVPAPAAEIPTIKQKVEEDVPNSKVTPDVSSQTPPTVAVPAPAPVSDQTENRSLVQKVDKAKPKIVTDLGLLGIDSSNKKHPLADQLDNTYRQIQEKENTLNDQMKNNSKAQAQALSVKKQKEKERLERLNAAETVDKSVLEWAKKYYKDPNLSDTEYLSQEKNKSILEFLQKKNHQDYIKQKPNWRLEVSPEKKASSPVAINQQKTVTPEMLGEVTNEKMALVNDKQTQPIVITNNNTNTGGGSDPAPISFGSASPRNTSTSINDYFRNNGRLHDAAYG